MTKWKVQRTVEALLEWDDIEAETEEEAHAIADDTSPRMSIMEETSSKAKEVRPEPVRQYWTAMGTFSITRYGTEAEARSKISEDLGDVCDEFSIDSLD